jgi:hypothetical protein
VDGLCIIPAGLYLEREWSGTGQDRNFIKKQLLDIRGLYRFLFNVHPQYLWQLEYYSIIGLKYKPV